MALIECNFFSEALGLSCSMNVILPQSVGKGMIGMKETGAGSAPPVLYLLHGMSDDHTIWLRRTSIERYAAPLGLAVVMPAVHRSYYTDMHEGGAYWTFVSEELPRIVESLFKVSADPRDRFVAGLSMGGYGAAKLALRRPDFFAAAASLSGAMDIHDIHRFYKGERPIPPGVGAFREGRSLSQALPVLRDRGLPLQAEYRFPGPPADFGVPGLYLRGKPGHPRVGLLGQNDPEGARVAAPGTGPELAAQARAGTTGAAGLGRRNPAPR